MPTASSNATQHSAASLVAVDGRTLPLRANALSVDAQGGLTRVVVSQVFHNTYAEPLRVTYQLALPLEAAVSAFTFW